jgi:hypothetical protein
VRLIDLFYLLAEYGTILYEENEKDGCVLKYICRVLQAHFCHYPICIYARMSQIQSADLFCQILRKAE